MNIKAILAITICALPFTLNAYDIVAANADGASIYYNIIGDVAEVTYAEKYKPTASYTGKLTIPATVESEGQTYAVTAIGERAFLGCSALSEVRMPESLTAIDMCAFAGCDNMEQITIPRNVQWLGANLFDGCFALTDIKVAGGNDNFSSLDGSLYDQQRTRLIAYAPGKEGKASLPSGISEIDPMAMYACSFVSAVDIPDGVETIGDNAMYFCNGLRSVEIPPSVRVIGATAFADCFGLEAINVHEANPVYASASGVLCDKELTTLIQSPAGKEGDALIPETVTRIMPQAFFRSYGLTTVMIPQGVTTIGEGAFIDCGNLTAVAIPESVHTIEPLAFAMCGNLRNVYLRAESPDSLSLGEGAFSGINPAECVLYVPRGKAVGYKLSDAWSVFDLIDEYDALKEQSIVWETEYTLPESGEAVITLDAVATSGLPVKYRLSTESNTIACIEGDKLIMPSEAEICVTATQDGDNCYEPAHAVTRIIGQHSGVSDVVNDSHIRVYSANRTIVIKGADEGQMAYIYDIDGRLVYGGLDRAVSVAGGNVYIVRVGQQSFKVLVK